MNMHHASVAFFAYIAGLSGIAAFCLWTSRINQFFFFGRTLSRDLAMSPAAKRITRRYEQRILFKSVLAVVVFVLLRMIAGLPLLPCFVLACVLEIIGFHVAFGRAHREAGVAFEKEHSGESSSATETAPRVIAVPLLESKVPVRSRLSSIVLPVILAGVGWLVVMAMSHLSFSSMADAVDSNGGSTLEGFGVGMLFAGTLFSLLMRYSARYRTPMAQCTLRTMFVLEWVGAITLVASALTVPLHFSITQTMARMVIFPVLALAVVYVIYSRSRLNRFAPPQVELNGDEFWRWGLFYNNAADPALFIQARTGPGYTLNFGKSLAWPIAAAVFGYFVLLVFLGFRHS